MSNNFQNLILTGPSHCALACLDMAYFHWAQPISLIRVGVKRGGRIHLTANMWMEWPHLNIVNCKQEFMIQCNPNEKL